MNDKEERLFNINDLVVGNILSCKKIGNITTLANSKSKFIFEKSSIKGKDIYRDTVSNSIIREFSPEYSGPYITNIENLTDYFNMVSYKEDNPAMLLDTEDILDLQEAVNMIYKKEKKNNKIKQKSL